MSVFVDTNVFVAVRNADDINHERAVKLMADALKGAYGRVFTSEDYILDEAVTLALVRTRRPELAIDVGKFILASPRITLLIVSADMVGRAWERFQELAARGLSFTDCTTLVLMEQYGIDYLLSFDRHFDGLARRIC